MLFQRTSFFGAIDYDLVVPCKIIYFIDGHCWAAGDHRSFTLTSALAAPWVVAHQPAW